MNFFAINTNFCNTSLDLLGSRRPAQAGIKRGTPLTVVIATAIGPNSSSVKTVADGHRHAAYHNKH